MDKSMNDRQFSTNTQNQDNIVQAHNELANSDLANNDQTNNEHAAAIQPTDVASQSTTAEHSNVDDLSWQRQLAAGGVLSAAQWQHLTPQQQQQWRQQAKARAQMDAQLYLAMQVPVPAQLADKILLAQSLALHNEQQIALNPPSATALLPETATPPASMPSIAPSANPSANRQAYTNDSRQNRMSDTTSDHILDHTPETTVTAFKAPPAASSAPPVRRIRWFNYGVATAASLVLLSGLWLSSAGWSPWYNHEQNLARHTFAHIYHELDALSTTSSIERATVNQMLQDWQLALHDDASNQRLVQQDHQTYAVQYARFCDFAGVRSLHLVFSTPQGPITVFLLPSTHTLDGDHQFSDARFHGQRVLIAKANHPTATDMVVVGAKAIPLDPIIRQIQQQLQPTTA